jgi:hypothetical protein
MEDNVKMAIFSFLKKWAGIMWTNSTISGYYAVLGSSIHSSDPSRPMKAGEFLGQLNSS